MVDSRTVLFAPAPAQTSLLPIERDFWSSAKSSVIRNGQIAVSAITGVVSFTDYHHVRRRNVNRGDIAISTAIERQISNQDPSSTIKSIGWDDVTDEELYQEIFDASRIVIGGGGYIFLDSTGALNARSRDLNILERYQGQVIAHGIGLNRLLFEEPWNDFRSLPPATSDWLRRFSARCKHISVRDAPTADFFADGAGVQVDLVGDPALSLTSPSRDFRADAHLSDIVGINTASHGRRALFCLRQLMPHLETTYRILARRGFRLKYFVHDDADYSVIRYLRLRGHRFDVVDGTPDVLANAYRSCNFVINQMLHSSILAFSVGTPCIAIAYDSKSIAFFDQFGLNDYCLRWNNVDSKQIIEKIGDLMSVRDKQRKTILNRSTELIGRQIEFLRKALS